MSESETKRCLNCDEILLGRGDKKFCNVYCKSAYHYKKNHLSATPFYNRVDKQLKQNRRLLKAYNKSGKSTVRAEVLKQEGFNPNFFTHFWKNTKGDVYLFVYEFGFLKRTESGKEKYVLVTWQEYMDRQF